MARALWVLASALLLVGAACGGGGDSAADAVKTNLEQMFDGQWGRMYDTLISGQQNLVSRDAFVNCNARTTRPNLDSVEVKETYSEQMNVPGVGSRDSTAVTVAISAGGISLTVTRHVVSEDGKWRWMLTQSEIDEYAAGKCP